MSKHITSIICCMTLLLVPQIPNAFAETGTVEGRVLDELGAPVMGAVVELVNAHKGVAIQAKGVFVFDDLPIGADTIRVTALGYYPFTFPITVSADSITVVDFTPLVMPIEYEHRVHGYPPPEDYNQKRVKISHIPHAR